MIHSMTAFARTQRQMDNGHLCWEIRSLNHRYLDVSFRLPESFRAIETSARALFRDVIHRGKVECQLKFQDTNANSQAMHINMGTVNALIQAGNQLALTHQLPNDLSVSDVLVWPGVIQPSSPNMDELQAHALALLDEAVSQLKEARAVEGLALKTFVESRSHQLSNEVSRARSMVSRLANQSRDKLLTRLHAVRLEVPEARVEQEIALIVSRLDVSEEIDRLQTHITEVNRALNQSGAGRRLDFLMQELNREANTLSSKSDAVELTQCAIEMKVLIEQMREQIQNIE